MQDFCLLRARQDEAEAGVHNPALGIWNLLRIHRMIHLNVIYRWYDDDDSWMLSRRRRCCLFSCSFFGV